MCKLIRFLIQYPSTSSGPGLFQFGIFLICFLTFLISICHLVLSALPVHSPPSSNNLCFLCVTAWSHVSLQKHLFSSASGITLSLYVPSNSLNNLFCFGLNSWFCLYCFALLSYFSSFVPQQLTSVKILWQPLPHLFFLHWTFLQAFIWCLHFAIHLVSFYLIVLTLCVIYTFCFSKIFLCQFGCLPPVISLFL